MKPKVFQFNPTDYGTDYQTVKRIYCFGFVMNLGNKIAVEYTFDWQLLGLFVEIANPPILPPPPAVPVIQPNKWDKWIALGLLLFLIWFIIWLLFL